MNSWQLWLPAQDQHSNMEKWAFMSQAPPLAEELLTDDGFWGFRVSFFKDVALVGLLYPAHKYIWVHIKRT